MKTKLLYSLFTLNLLFTTIAHGTKLTGVIIDDDTNQAIPFVNIWVQGTTIGTISNIEGCFSIRIDSCSIINFSSVGYIAQSKELTTQNTEYSWEIRLKSDVQNINEISIKPNFSYDEEMFKKVVSHKRENEDNLTTIKRFSNYDRTTVLLAANKDSKIQKFLDIPEDVIIKDKDEVSFLPVYYSESLMNVTMENDKEINVINNEKDGILPNLNEQIESVILEKIAVDFNFYKNQITILNRGFISPLSNVALLYYNIYLTDSLICNNVKHYKFSFFPKNKHDLVFKGHFWAENKSFALVNIEVSLPPKANINFLQELNVNVNYEKQFDGKWFYKDQKINAKFSFGKNTSFSVDDSQYNNIEKGGLFHVNKSLQYYIPADTLSEIDALPKENPFSITINKIEKQIKSGIIKLKQNQIIKCFDKVSDMLLSGYYTEGAIEIGPIFDFYSTNKIEGNRFTIPVRTGASFCKKFSLGGYLGYGTKNNEFKYGISVAYQLPFITRSIISGQYSDDYILASKNQYTQFIQENPFSKGSGNFISALTSNKQNAFVYEQKRIEIKLETDLTKNIGLSVNPYYNRNYSSDFIRFKTNNADIRSFDNMGMLINFRFSHDRNYDELYFARVYYGNSKPVINTSFDLGQILPYNENINYGNFYALSNISIKHRFSLGQAYIRYMINAGYMLGNVPFTLLDKPYGTNSLGYSRYSFNLLDYASFAHNLYTNIHLNLNGGGIIFNHIPFISNLNLREMVSLKCHYGKRNKQLKNTIDIPDFYNNRQTKPYIELGFGISNIFKALRIEYVTVVGNKDAVKNYAIKHGIRMRFEVMF